MLPFRDVPAGDTVPPVCRQQSPTARHNRYRLKFVTFASVRLSKAADECPASEFRGSWLPTILRLLAAFSQRLRCSLPQRNATLSAGALIRSTWLLYFSQPANDRALYKAVKGRTIRSVLEFGIGDGTRTKNLIEVISWEQANLPLRYTGIDLFEGRPKGQKGLTLKQAFAEIRAPEVKVQLIPGLPYDALLRCASTLSETDLIILAADQRPEDFEKAWKFIARTVHDKTLILREQPAGPGKTVFQTLPVGEVHRLARESGRVVRRAA